MNIPSKTALVVLALGASVFESAAQSRMQDAASHESLVEKARHARATRVDPVATMKQAEGEDPSVVNRPADLIARSDILTMGDIATLVPKRAIIHIPDNLKSRVGIKPGVRIVNWHDFFVRNRGWIQPFEVDRPTAEGVTPLDEEIYERFQKNGRVVIATLRGGPISVLPPKEEEKSENPEAVAGTPVAGTTENQTEISQ